jgi:integrase
MPRRSQALLSTDREVSSARVPGDGRVVAEYRVAGTPNLVLRVTARGHRAWTYWLKRPKTARWQKYNIGPYPAVTLARARDEAVRLRRAVVDGEDPFDARTAGRGILSIKALGETFIKRYSKPKKRSWAEDERKLERDVYPVLGDYRADLVTKPDLVRLLDAIRDRGAPIHANRTLALLRKMFNWAGAEGYLQTPNPAAGIPMRAQEVVRRRVLDNLELQLLWRALDGPGFDAVTADSLKLQLLLGARIREVTGMERCELALDQTIPVWTLPAARAKGRRDVPRPLCEMALQVIRRRLLEAGKSPFVFASPIDPLSAITPQAPTRALSRAGIAGRLVAFPTKAATRGRSIALPMSERAAFWGARGFTPHDLRRTARTYWAKLGIVPELARKLLGHSPPRSDVDALVYDQYTAIPEMHQALRKWEQHLAAIVERHQIEGVAA